MIKINDIYKATNLMLSGEFNLKIYGNEISEGFKAPCFFVRILPTEISNESTNFKHKSYTIQITYFQKVLSQSGCHSVIDTVESLFGLKMLIEDRYVNVADFSYSFTGSKKIGRAHV